MKYCSNFFWFFSNTKSSMTIKLKPINEDKKDLVERFKVLRGQFIAGNNAPTLIKELRSIILHFMEKGQIQKQDGYDLLKELSAVEN